MKSIIISLILLCATPMDLETTATYVYVCTGPYAKRYHKTKTCRGLSNCSESIVKVLLKDAIADGRTQCKTCYK